MRKRPRQLALPLTARFTHGGSRPGAGRKRRSALQSHVRRAPFDGAHHPLHVTIRVAAHVWNLRSQRGFACVAGALRHEASLGELRVVHYSVQGNHVHLVVEASDQRTLSRRMQGFGIRLARRLNALMGRRGRVYADRYHARALTSPRAAFHAIRYVLQNHAKHGAQTGRRVPVVDRFASSSLAAVVSGASSSPAERGLPPPTAAPETWLLRRGFRRGVPSPRAGAA